MVKMCLRPKCYTINMLGNTKSSCVLTIEPSNVMHVMLIHGDTDDEMTDIES